MKEKRIRHSPKYYSILFIVFNKFMRCEAHELIRECYESHLTLGNDVRIVHIILSTEVIFKVLIFFCLSAPLISIL